MNKESKKNYNNSIIIGIVCNIVGLFILGYVFSGTAYFSFKNAYNISFNEKKKRTIPFFGMIISIFLFGMSTGFHSRDISESYIDRMKYSLISGFIFGIFGIIYLLIKEKKMDKKIEYNKRKKQSDLNNLKCSKCGSYYNIKDKYCKNCNMIFNSLNEYRCDNCGAIVKESATKCPNCGEKFVKESILKYKCDNCGTFVKESATKCPNCGEKFEEESKKTFEKADENIDKKYNDLMKLKRLLDKQIISKKEFEQEKKKILNNE